MPINSNMNFSPAGMTLGLGGIGGQNLAPTCKTGASTTLNSFARNECRRPNSVPSWAQPAVRPGPRLV